MKEPILYLDDEEANLSSFRMALGLHFKIYLASSIREAFNILAEKKIKVLISDQRMPELTGLEFITEVKSRYPATICMILTAYTDVEVVLKAINQGHVYRFILKPWDNEEMIQIIKNAIGTYDLQSQNKNLIQALQEKNEKLEAAKIKAEESDRLKSAFLANMSHEIRTPMNGIIGFSEMLADPNVEPRKRAYYSEIVIKSADQLLRIVNDIIDISKIETGQLVLHTEQFKVNELLTDLYQFFKPQAIEKKLSMEMINDFSDSQPDEIISDKTKLYQVLSNLISNALKFTHMGSITFGVQQKNNAVYFFVEDTGIGISEENIRFIFDRFRQVENNYAHHYGGTGLGLAISKALIKKLGGELGVDSTLGKGSRFYFSLPK